MGQRTWTATTRSNSTRASFPTAIIMATFSPAPAHRRASLMRTSPRAGGSRKPSRMSLTPFSDAYTEETGMDVDEGSTAPTETAMKAKPSKELLYANSREFKVSYYAGLPLEVKTALQKNNSTRPCSPESERD